jgi:hypothetical protein
MATANALWRAPRIHSELKMLGIRISERTVSRILRSGHRPGPPRPGNVSSQSSRSNRVGRLLHCSDNPAASLASVPHIGMGWTTDCRGIRRPRAPRYLIRDRDGAYGNDVRRRLQSLSIEELLTAHQSLWQNAYVERLIGSIRRECLNHFIVLNARHLKRTLAAYLRYYHRSRPHLARKAMPDRVSDYGA